MTPSPQSEAITPSEVPPSNHGDQVVISGMSGLYPQSRYVRDLEKILYDKTSPVTKDLRWTSSHPEVAQYSGNVPDLELFDAQFFKVHYRLSINMDAMSRKLLEQAYEAIYDAGVNPESLSGKKVGVYIGTCFSETEKAGFYSVTGKTGLGIAGCNKSMFANRISYWLNAKGPSLSIDVACCSSMMALEQAYLAMMRGDCEAAIVGGANICLHPQSSVHYQRIIKMSKDGQTKSYQSDASGCVKSEAINLLFLQKAKDALRIYANVVNVNCEYIKIPQGETGPQYGFYRAPEDTSRFLNSFYDRAGVSPAAVEYVEGFGSAVSDADKAEIELFDKVFCKDREGPLLIGSVMSNIGYGEAASGISAITKVLLGYHRGELAGNLNYDSPRDDLPAIREGRIQVLSDHKKFRRTYTAVNNISVTGVNAHALLHGNFKPKDLRRYKTTLPYLVTLSGRQDSSVVDAFTELKSHPIDPEQLALLQNIHQTKVTGHLGRGYLILDTKDGETVSLSEQVDYYDGEQRPLWFVYSGMGSQWVGMGKELMRIPVFAAAIERCNRVLAPKGLDIVDIITTNDKNVFDKILHSFVGIAAVQIGLTDILRELGLVPDNMIGHSVGELGCAYADGSLTAEEMILSAYSRGKVSSETPFIKGSMAAVGLGFQEASKLCPPEIVIACHNSAESCTISGPADAMQTFVASLGAKGIFAKEVPCSNIAYHSRYIAEAGPALLEYLKEVIKTPRPRSGKWLSTSVPHNQWNEELAKYCSAEYHTNNLLNPVLFEEASALIPSNAVLVEVAPHGLLQAILKRSLPATCTNIPLTRRGHSDSPRMLLDALGKLYMEGYNVRIQALYPKVEFPVSSGTPFLSPLVGWAHDEKWPMPLFVSANRVVTACYKFVVSEQDDDFKFMKGNVIREKTLLPFTSALVAVWDTLAMTQNVPKKQLNVIFSNVFLYTQPELRSEGVTLAVSLLKGNGQFEVMDGDVKVASGIIESAKYPNLKSFIKLNKSEKDMDLSTREVYQLFRDREYEYSGEFRSIKRANDTLSEAEIEWNDNWVTLLDGIFQLNALRRPHIGVSEISLVRSIVINVDEHRKEADGKSLKAYVSDVNDLTRCGGVLVENLKFNDLPPLKKKETDLKTLTFVPRFQSNIDTCSSLQIFTQIIAENANKDIIKAVGILNEFDDTTVFNEMKRVAADIIPEVKVDYQTIDRNVNNEKLSELLKDTDVLLVQNLSKDKEVARILQKTFYNDVFIINKETLNATKDTKAYEFVSVLTDSDANSRLELLRTQQTVTPSSIYVVVQYEKDILSLMTARNNQSENTCLTILTTYPPVSGLIQLVKQWRKESTHKNIKLIMANDTNVTEQLAKLPGNLVYNVLDDGVWGGEYYLPLKENQEKVNDIILQSDVIGDLETLKWTQAPVLPKHGIPVKVHYAGININDVMRATGEIPTSDEDGYGMEFSGVLESGDRVMGLLPSSTARSHVMARPEFMWPVPSYWSLEDAATVPLAYVYAYYCLHLKIIHWVSPKSLHPTILIHGGSGALGQAMISVSLAKGYKVFTTVGNENKKKFLLRLYPQLRDENIGNSRDLTFADMVMSATGGVGCDVVVCCLTENLKNYSIKCIRPCGTIFDLTHLQKCKNYNFGMYSLVESKSYNRIEVSSIFSDSADDNKLLHNLVTEGIVRGVVRPLTRVTFAPQQVSRAFGMLAASRHCGRVLIQLEGSHPVKPRFTCSAEKSYIVFSDRQPLGEQLTDMLISCGAKNIYLHTTQPPSQLSYKLRMWKNQDVQVSLSSDDLNIENGVSSFLQKVSNSGLVEGVFLAAKYITEETMIKKIDSVIRMLCPNLKNFMIFNDGDGSSKFDLLKRAKGYMAATTIVDLSMLQTVNDEDGAIWYKGIKEVAEQSLLSSHKVLAAQLKELPKKSLVQQIADLTGIAISGEVKQKTTLKNLGATSEKSKAISELLRNTYNVSVDAAHIPALTIERINRIEESLKNNKTEKDKGIEKFFSYVDSDELLATTEIVLLPTLARGAGMRDDEFNAELTSIYILPGLEGHHRRFTSLCEKLKLPAIVLQPGLDFLQETVEEQAQRYYTVLKERTGIHDNFYLLGYETGVLVALEVAALLEKHGLTGTVFCIGDGPEELKAELKQELQKYKSEEEAKTALLRHMYAMITGKAIEVTGASWKEKLDICCRAVLGQAAHSAQFVKSLIEAAYARIATAVAYNTQPKVLKSKIVLLKALQSTPSTSCSLQRYSEAPIVTYNLTSSLVSASSDMRCAAFINQHLSKEMLDDFNTKNLCDTYLSNGDQYMSYV